MGDIHHPGSACFIKVGEISHDRIGWFQKILWKSVNYSEVRKTSSSKSLPEIALDSREESTYNPSITSGI
jgi:hypothetical protein